ncbi:penicillin-binding protein 2 [[Clostridium] innocuum]|nr:penicillin-binding protein 2 [Erysipelotrichaceae bacterium]MCR0384714.1 penicillin-binding protein 2 [[Clostridium] innocuum]MCR0534471.1 penicillin-binding protein 2 [[Clostridium] innocuum]MCR0538252.1 penicillin-binding protein 2 [[Clostridium] innocuum]MDU1121018.1 penicillin-binding protein 2 [Erysipelotrichaceae bacterium]
MIRNPFRDLDQKKLSRSSDVLKTQNDYFKIVNRRIFIFGIIICLIFAVVSVRLVFLQIRNQEDYAAKLENYSSQKQTDSTARGEMVDRNGKVIAKTVSSHNIVYFPPKDTTSEEQWKLAQTFAKDFKVDHKGMTNSDYQDLYMFLHKDEKGNKDSGQNLLSEQEKETLTAEDQEKKIRSRITMKMVDELADDDTKDAFSVYLSMRKLPNNQNKVILEDVDSDSVAKLMENKDKYRGFDVNLGSWKREYPYKDTLRDVLGSITTSKQGVPSELRSYYEAMGYSLTDRVGQSGLEKQYEDLLSGTPRVSEISYDSDGTAIMNETSSGKNGYDLHLTIDVELQKKVDDILEDTLKKYAGTAGREKFKKAIVVLMNPQTGEIYAMSGKYLDEDGKIQNYSSGAYLDAFASGSVVKGATVYMMLDQGIQTRYSTEQDEQMKIAGTPFKRSFNTYGTVNSIRALAVSSNVYMFKSVIKLAGGNYVYNQPLGITNEMAQETFKLMRNYYSMFGLGTKTGLDVPNEAQGFTGNTMNPGLLLDYSIGQYDNYTPIQLVQYAATIANGGKKIQPKLVNTATEVNTDYTVYENKTQVLSALPGSKEDLETIQMGFREVVAGEHAIDPIKSLDVQVAAKTGTAEVGNYTNASLVGYAPYDKEAKVAFACSVPESATNDQSVAGNLCAYNIMPEVLKEFFKKY